MRWSHDGRAFGFSAFGSLPFDSKSNNIRTVSSFAGVAPGVPGVEGS